MARAMSPVAAGADAGSATIRIEHLGKSFSGVAVLADVSLELAGGQVHGLLGENGAGKSTLMNILFGLERPDQGQIQIAGVPVSISSPRIARALGIGMVHQHFTLVPSLSVIDNLALALSPGLGPIRRPELERHVAAQADRLQWSLDFSAQVGSLSVGAQQRVEILKALAATGATPGTGQILILDEPTAVLTPREVDEFLPAIRTLAAGGTTVILISHKLQEVGRCCDTVSILRRGRLVHSGPVQDISRDQMAIHMIGQPLAPTVTTRSLLPAGAMVQIAIDDLVVEGEAGLRLLDHVSMHVSSGEIVGIAGIDGNGQIPLAHAIFGLIAPTSGQVRIACGRAHLGVIPEDRHREALVLSLSVTENMAMRAYARPPLSQHGWLRLHAWEQHARRLAEVYDVRAASLSQSAESLSGGNQQKMVIARELERDPPAIVAINPTRGLDVGATAFVFRQLVAARDCGAAVVVIHSDLDELLSVADRIVVLASGRLRPSRWPDCDRAAIGRLMLGLDEVVS
jgi:simple sugar transport system ATP-binding protein